MKQITAYRCDHCKRVTVTPRAMKAHEEQCLSNPAKRTCFTCEHDGGPEFCAAGCRLDAVKIVRQCPEWSPAEGYAE